MTVAEKGRLTGAMKRPIVFLYGASNISRSVGEQRNYLPGRWFQPTFHFPTDSGLHYPARVNEPCDIQDVARARSAQEKDLHREQTLKELEAEDKRH